MPIIRLQITPLGTHAQLPSYFDGSVFSLRNIPPPRGLVTGISACQNRTDIWRIRINAYLCSVKNDMNL